MQGIISSSLRPRGRPPSVKPSPDAAEVITMAYAAGIAGCGHQALKRVRAVDPSFPVCFALHDTVAPGATTAPLIQA